MTSINVESKLKSMVKLHSVERIDRYQVSVCPGDNFNVGDACTSPVNPNTVATLISKANESGVIVLKS